MENEEYIESGLSVGTMKIANKYEIFTEEEVDAINNKIPELDERVSIIEYEIEDINSSLDDIEIKKATRSEVDLERKRIDNLSKLNEGSTTGDAELIDGRIDNDGVTHTNIGTAIRKQIDKVNKTLLKELINFNVEGYYVYKDGNLNPLGGWRTTDYIKVNRGDIVQITALGYQGNVSGIYLYDVFKNKIKPLQILNDINQTYTVIVPSDGYIRCSGRRNDHDVLTGAIYRLNTELLNFINDYNKNNSFNLCIDDWNNGGYVSYENGNIFEFNGFSYTNYIDISDLNNMYMYITEYYEYLAGVAFYDENMKFIDGIGIGGNHKHENLGKLSTIQLKGKYMRITCTTDYLSKFKLYTSLNLISKSINSFNEKGVTINTVISLHDNFTWTSGAYIKYDTGEVITINNDYSHTDFIDISNIAGATVQITEYYDFVSGIAFYDKNKKFISGVSCESRDKNNNLGQVINLTLKGKYMRITCKTNFIYSFKMYFKFGDLIKKTDDINPCFYNGNLNLIKIFNKVVCIGDSYTEGSIEYKNSDGQNLQNPDSRYSYPTQLSKIANIQTVNLGHAGYTSTQWYNKYQNVDLSGYDCAIIFLGINDWFRNNNTLDTTSYTNIINKLRNDNKNIPIFCVTITKNYLTNAYKLNPTIKEVALNNNCYVIDLGEFSDWEVNSKWLNGAHPNTYGYYHNAEMINSYINYIIENNKADFYNLSFVGTDKIDF